MTELKQAMTIGNEIELYYKDDQALLEPDYKGGWVLTFASNPDKEIKLSGIDEVLDYKVDGSSLFDNLRSYQIY